MADVTSQKVNEFLLWQAQHAKALPTHIFQTLYNLLKYLWKKIREKSPPAAFLEKFSP